MTLQANTLILGIGGGSLVGLWQLLLQAGFFVKETAAAIAECRGFSILFVISTFVLQTRRLATCTQAVIVLWSTSDIAIEVKCSVLKVVQNSVESMRSSYSAFDYISWNWLIAYYSFTDLYHVKWVKIVMSAYEYFSLFSLAFAVVVVCLFVCFISQTRETFWISELRWFVT